MNESSKLIPVEGVSKKLKAIVIILTVLTLFAFVALFTKLASKQPIPKKTVPVVHEPTNATPLLINEYKAVGTRLMNSGLKEQAIDQFIKVWEMQKTGSAERSQAAQIVGRLYADLNNCQEALVWLFRAEVSHSDTTQSPLIDTCLAKVRSNNPGQ
jgi:hypothetical protein